MPVFETQNFGPLPYEEETALDFPRGLPGFENCRRFLALSLPNSEPLVFLQSLEESGLCFITAPVAAVAPGYRLAVSPEDLDLIGLSPAAQPRIGQDVLCLAVLTIREEGPTANLLAPVVVNLANRRAVQAVSAEAGYSHQHVLLPAGAQPAAEDESCRCSV